MSTGVTTDFLSLTGNTKPAWIIGIPRTSAFLIIGVFFDLLGNGSPVLSRFPADFTKGSVLLQAFGNDQTVFIR